MSAAYTLSRIWAGILSFFRARPSVEEQPRAAEPTVIPLRELVLVRASRPRSQKTFPLMLEGVSARSFYFKTQNLTLAEGDSLDFDALLRGVGPVKLSGKIAWLLTSSLGYSGEVLLEDSDPAVGEAWARYVELQRRGSRGKTAQ
jgi:hypothetical protein